MHKKIIQGTISVFVCGLMLFTQACNATTTLQKIDSITKAAEGVVTAVEGATCGGSAAGPNCITVQGLATVSSWLTAVQAANEQALKIANGAATLTAQQITAVIELYSNAAIQNFPSGLVPPAVAAAINLAMIAVNALLAVLSPAAASAAIHPIELAKQGINTLEFSYTHARATARNKKLKSDISNMLGASLNKMTGPAAGPAFVSK